MQPGPRVTPVSLGRYGRDAQDVRRLLEAEAAEEAEPDQSGLQRTSASRRVIASSRAINSSAACGRPGPPRRGQRGQFAAVLLAALPPGVLDEDAAHRLGGGGEEVAAPIPAPVAAVADEARYASWTGAVGWRVCPRVRGPGERRPAGGAPAVDQRQQSRPPADRPAPVPAPMGSLRPPKRPARRSVRPEGGLYPRDDGPDSGGGDIASRADRCVEDNAAGLAGPPSGSIQPDSRPGQGRRPCRPSV